MALEDCGAPDSGIPAGFEGYFHLSGINRAFNLVLCGDGTWYFSIAECDVMGLPMGRPRWTVIDGGVLLDFGTPAAVATLSDSFDGFRATGFLVGDWYRGAVCDACGSSGPLPPVGCALPDWGH